MIQLWPWILVLCDARCSEHIYSNSEPLPTKLTVIQFMTVEIRLLMETPHKHVDPCVTWLVGKCSSSRWWVSWGEWQVCPPLCLIQWRSCVLEFLLCESWATRRSHLGSSWTLSLCEPSQVIVPAAASESSVYISDFEPMPSERRFTQGNCWRDTSAVRRFKPVTCLLCVQPSVHTNVSELTLIKY